jgi:hypothetical protein
VIPVIINGVTLVEGNKHIHNKGRSNEQKQGHKIVIIGNSHVQGCAGNMKNNLSETRSEHQHVNCISESTDKDIAIFGGGANDVSNNNVQEGLKYIVNFV